VLRGRRPIPVFLNPDAASVLGIDIGKRTTTVLLTNLVADTIETFERPTPSFRSPQACADWAVEMAQAMFTATGNDIPPLCGIGVALPGLVSIEATEGTTSAPVPEGIGAAAVEPVRAALAAIYIVEVLVDNDARIMVPGVQWSGSEESHCQSFVVISIGYGLGIGVALNGQILSGAHGFAGEIGHIPLGRPDIACYCGRLGCLDNTASGAALSSMALQQGLPTSDVTQLATMARNGNVAAREVFSTFAMALGRGVATLISLFNPEAVIIHGKVSRAADLFMPAVKEAVARHTLPAPLANVKIVVADPEKNLSSLGAVAVVLNKIYFSSQVTFEEVI